MRQASLGSGQETPRFQAEPLPYSEFGPPIGLQHPIGYSMHLPNFAGGYSRPMHFQEGGVVSPYLPKTQVILTPQEADFCWAQGISFAAFARHKLQASA